MTVYVDNANIQASVPNGGRTVTSRWCHMMADSVEELVQFAYDLGLRIAWIQVKKSGVHFDLTSGKRYQALRRGAVEIPMRSEEWRRVVAAARDQFAEAEQKFGATP